MRALVAALLLALAWAMPASAQQVVISPAPEAVSVTVYRNGYGGEMDLRWLGGYALITETRTISLPAGDSVIRFEGVAGNILPVSAIVRGLPRAVAEKNHDARLLSAGALVDAALGRQVHIRRTNPATGKVTETEAIIRSGPDGIVLQTSEGFEALRCTGLPETLVYAGVPPGLSARPTLAVTTHADAPVTATVQLSYLAGQFDWRANYVATVAPDGRSLDLFAWLTLANANDESFPDASAQVVAGRPNREQNGQDGGAAPVSPEISLRCWPAGTTSDVAYLVPPPPPPPPPSVYDMDAIIVTGSRVARANFASAAPITVVTAQLEGLGDLKLYRIPVPVTVAANAQKQVALLHMGQVRFDRLYAASIQADDDNGQSAQASILLRTKNVEAKGMGRPLPSGTVAVFETVEGRQMLVGEAPIADTPVGQDVEIRVGESPDVSVAHKVMPDPTGKRHDGYRPVRHEVLVSNARPVAIDLELGLPLNEGEYRLAKASHKLGRKNGAALWRAQVPANGTARLTYQVERKKSQREGHD